ncbi:MAG: tetratricopeptide repeat protein [Betaproteobacteria bacterium]
MKARQAASIAAGLLLAAAAWAGPAEDFAAGRAAYDRGDVRTAISILGKSADAGHSPSQVLLGEILDLAEQNEDAVRYYRLASDQGNLDGTYGLALMYAGGEGVPKDPRKARELIQKAAEGGHVQATHALAAAYIGGGLAMTEEERASPAALGWIEKSASADSLPAIDRLAVAYRKGDFGVAADPKKAEALEARARVLRNVKSVKAGKNGKKKPNG